MENIENELSSALDLLNSEQYVEAKAKLEKILADDSNNIEALKNLGLCEVNLDNPIDAIKVFKKVTDLDSNDATSLFYLANCYNRTGQKEFAIDNLKKVIELRPNYVDAYKTLAMIYIEFAQYTEAVDIIKNAIDNPDIENDYSLYYILATVYMLEKDTVAATKYLELANSLNPTHSQIANSLAVCYMNSGLFEKVLPVLDSVYEADKNDSLTLYNYGVYYQTTEDFKKALEYFQAAYEIEPSATMLSTLANCAFKANELQLASTLYKNLVSAYPNNTLYRLTYLEVLESVEDFEEALKNVDFLLQNDPKNIKYLKKLGAYLRKLSRFEQSIEVFQTLIKRGKIDVEVYYNLAFNYVLLSDFDNAKEMFKKCIELEPNNPYAHKDLGVLYLKMNFYDWAVDEMQEAIDLEPDVAEFHYALGVAFMMLSKIEEAKKAFEDTLKLDSEFFDAWAYLGYVYLLERDYERAYDNLQRALKINPSGFLAKTYMAKYYFATEKYDTAKEFLMDTLDKTKDDETENMLAICYMKTGDYTHARNLFYKLIDRYPENHILFTNLAYCEHKIGEDTLALEHIRRALLIFDDYKEAKELLEEIKSNEH